MIVIKINDVLATRSRVIYLGRRPHRATLILFNLLSISINTLIRDYSIIDYYYLKKSRRRSRPPNVIINIIIAITIAIVIVSI